VGTESPILTQEGAVSEKSAGNDVDYAAKSRMARQRAVLRWLIQFWLANSLPSNTISAIQSWKKEIPDKYLLGLITPIEMETRRRYCEEKAHVLFRLRTGFVLCGMGYPKLGGNI
jgi:hypothetical protein